MKRKIMTAILIVVVSFGVMACGTDKPKTVENPVQEVTVENEVEEMPTDSTAVVDVNEGEEEKEAVSESSETDTKEEMVETKTEEKKPITWYMDEEGLKSDVLGMIIKRENAVFEEIGLLENLGVWFGNTCCQQVFECNYYEGDMESYLAENSHMAKDKMGEIEYAYGEEWGDWNVVFVGNGVMISTRIWCSDLGNNQNLNDFLSSMNVITEDNEFDKDCLAYLTADGLYCPALGLAFSCEDSKNVVNVIGVSCWKEDYSASIKIDDESAEGMGTMYYMADTNSAQEVVDKYVEGAIEPNEYKTVEQAEIEGTVEVKIGKYNFLGRGVTVKNEYFNDEDWLFYSDDATWSVTVSYEAGNHYEDYLSAIERIN